MKPLKHAELIKAWADGHKIQEFVDGQWMTCLTNPYWFSNAEYRIKPEPKPDVVQYFISSKYETFTAIACTSNLKLTFDGETGKLKSAEVLK